jgi:hypothetical protein
VLINKAIKTIFFTQLTTFLLSNKLRVVSRGSFSAQRRVILAVCRASGASCSTYLCCSSASDAKRRQQSWPIAQSVQAEPGTSSTPKRLARVKWLSDTSTPCLEKLNNVLVGNPVNGTCSKPRATVFQAHWHRQQMPHCGLKKTHPQAHQNDLKAHECAEH